MYRQGMKPDMIAHERNLTLGTVMGHLARYVDGGDVLLDDLVPPAHQKGISAVIRQLGADCTASAVMAHCPPDVTYDEVRLMLSRTVQK